MTRRPRRLPRTATRAIVADAPQLTGRGAGAGGAATDVDRAIDTLASSVQRLAAEPADYIDVDLVVGTNRLNHGLGRKPIRVLIMPRDANASFAWGFDPAQLDNPHPDRQAWITVAGAVMAARVFFY